MNAPKSRIRRRHLPTGVVVETHERATPERTQPTNEGAYAPPTVYRFTNGGYEAVTRR